MSFPLMDETTKIGQTTGKLTAIVQALIMLAALAATFAPATDLEMAISSVLEASKTVEHDLKGLTEAEGIALKGTRQSSCLY